MASPALSSPDPSAPGSEGSAPPGTTTQVAAVWCRQVDNEAESPGYTTIPEEFPGHRETLEVIRLVGHLTVNVADTHDYWDPDPSQRLSFYPNLFLYPAYSGRYTCVGRMFLSTEDRPRLGMKTLVLDTQALLDSGEFGGSVLRWHASIGGATRPAGRPPPAPPPSLYPLVGEGFLFHRGSTDPVLLIAGEEEWEASMQVIAEMVRLLPASLVSLGAILAFPYFLPQPKTNLHELGEQLPLALSLMRIPRRDAAGDRHEKRVAGWESTPFTVRDLTQGVPTPPAKSKETVPLVLQYLRDHAEAKIAPIGQRVDFVETPRLRRVLYDPERQGGKDRRKEMWRIGTAMESAALLLQKARGRHVPVNVETAKRAQEYIQARVPDGEATTPSPEPAIVAEPVGAATTPALPPWLQRPVDPSMVPGPRGEQSVPVSTSDDPSLLPPDPRTPAPRTSSAPIPPIGAAVDPTEIKKEIERGISKFVDDRVGAAHAQITSDRTRELSELERRLADRITQLEAALATSERQRKDEVAEAIRAARANAPGSVTPLLADLEAKLRQEVALSVRASEERNAEKFPSALADSEKRFRGDLATSERATGARAEAALSAAMAASEARQQKFITDSIRKSEENGRSAVPPLVASEVDRRLATTFEPRLAEAQAAAETTLKSTLQATHRQLSDELASALTDLKKEFRRSEEELRVLMTTQLDLHFREAVDREKSSKEELERRFQASLGQKITEAEQKRAREQREADQKYVLLIEGRQREASDRMTQSFREDADRRAESLVGKFAQTEAKLAAAADARMTELTEAQGHAIADLQVRIESFIDQKLREELTREREKYLELLARLKGEVDVQLGRVGDLGKTESLLKERLQKALDQARLDMEKLADVRIGAAEARLRGDQTVAVDRLTEIERDLVRRGTDLLDVERAVRHDVSELDRRMEILSDRLVPIVRKTWIRIGELEKVGPGSSDGDAKLRELRRELQRELRRIESDVAERTSEIRDRMEATIASQGKVWLSLVRQLAAASDSRRRAALVSDEPADRAGGGLDTSEEDRSLDDLPALLRSSNRRGAIPDAIGLNGTEEPPEDERPERRRERRSSR